MNSSKIFAALISAATTIEELEAIRSISHFYEYPSPGYGWDDDIQDRMDFLNREVDYVAQTIDDLVQNLLEIIKDDKILPEVALVAAAKTVNDLAAIARSQRAQIEDLKKSLEAFTLELPC